MTPEQEWEEEEENEDCDYGLFDFCEHPELREIGCCFECPLYLEAVEEEKKDAKKA